ncbi:MAG: DUF4335 domain-containing protein, partial [Synechococcaceae bacterium WB8_1B_057]|nr:DUF4335 domain-containing protein [Synechococcaceae bacterium WB8_1B_057]
GHQLQLRSSQPNTPPLDLQLDDAELADLTQCLDQMLLDPRQGLRLEQPIAIAKKKPLSKAPSLQRLASPAAALAAVALCGLFSLLLPLPRPISPGSPQQTNQNNRP